MALATCALPAASTVGSGPLAISPSRNNPASSKKAAARSPQQLARYVLGAAAFALFDHVARESIRGALWARVENPRGPKFSGTARSARERQAKRRARLKQTVSAPI